MTPTLARSAKELEYGSTNVPKAVRQNIQTLALVTSMMTPARIVHDLAMSSFGLPDLTRIMTASATM